MQSFKNQLYLRLTIQKKLHIFEKAITVAIYLNVYITVSIIVYAYFVYLTRLQPIWMMPKNVFSLYYLLNLWWSNGTKLIYWSNIPRSCFYTIIFLSKQSDRSYVSKWKMHLVDDLLSHQSHFMLCDKVCTSELNSKWQSVLNRPIGSPQLSISFHKTSKLW